MRKLFIFFSSLFALCFCGSAQYTPLPALDEVQYAKFVGQLRSEATIQNIPELSTIADNMSYDEARRFLAHPYVFMDKLKREETPKEDKPVMNSRTFGIVMAVMLNSLTGLEGYSKNQSKIGFSLGAYGLFALTKVYILTELLYEFKSFAEKSPPGSGSWSEIYKTHNITLFTAFLYAIEMQTMKLLVGLGPNLGYMMSGTDTFKTDGDEDKDKFEFGSDDWKHPYFGINFVAGLLLANNFMIYLNYTLPLSKLHGDWDAKLSHLRIACNIPLSK